MSQRPHHHRTAPVLLSLALLASVHRAAAQTTRSYVTIESRIDWSQSAYVGPIAQVRRPPQLQTGRNRFELTVCVDKVLKGEKRQQLQLGMDTVLPLTCLQAYASNKTQFMWFIMRQWPDAAPFDSWVVTDNRSTNSAVWDWRRLGPEVPERKGFASQEDGINLFSMDLQVLKTPSQIVHAATRYAANRPLQRDSIFVYIPWGLAARCGPPNEITNQLWLPVVPEVELLGRKLLTHPDKMLKPAATLPRWTSADAAETYRSNELTTLRRAGVEILARFPSGRNGAILQKYRNDPALHERIFQIMMSGTLTD